MSHLPIGDYALLSDCHRAALVSREGSIDWYCLPRFDSPAVFGRLLDVHAGHWSIRPAGRSVPSRRYHEGTLVLETAFEGPTGSSILTDALALGEGEQGHQLGVGAPGVLLRKVECTSGSMEFLFEYAPRPEFGIVLPHLVPADEGIVGLGGAIVMLLASPLPISVAGPVASCRFELRAGESVCFALQHRSSWEPHIEWWNQEKALRRLDETISTWRTWSQMHQNYDGPWRELVSTSGRVLQALTYVPTGAIVAAPTTSLPETKGGTRNWDYRYTWIRDASLTLGALWVAACPDEAHAFFTFLAGAPVSQLRTGRDLQIMFGIGGEHDLTERVLPQLRGWRGSLPVRLGNAAWKQKQLDVYGELLGAAYRLKDYLDDLDHTARSFLAEVADKAAAEWREPDHGIWEVRGPPRDFVHSKLMCWVALDRAISLASLLGAERRVLRWRQGRDEIREAILQRGFNPKVGAFTQSFDSDDLDAACLLVPLTGFLPPSDPRVRSTVRAIAEGLSDSRGLIYRYRSEDGLPGHEGTFLLCTFWLAHAYALEGNLEKAKETFSLAASFGNDLGLFSEEVDPETGELLGNFPQAFSHVGLVNSAWAISQLETGTLKSPEAAPR